MLPSLSIHDFTDKLASKDATPGGGSVAAVSGLMGVSLMEMVINLSLGRQEFAQYYELLTAKQKQLAVLHRQIEALIDADAQAFQRVMDALKLPKATKEDKAVRTVKVQAAMKEAAEVPLATAKSCLEVLKIGKELVGKVNAHAVSDLAIGALNSHTGAVSALFNTAINLEWLTDKALVAALTQEMQAVRAAADRAVEAITTAIYAEKTFAVMRI